MSKYEYENETKESYGTLAGLNFGEAMEQIRYHGKSYMRLKAWGKDVKIFIQYSDESSKMSAMYFYVKSRFGRVPWIPNMIELFSTDWEVS